MTFSLMSRISLSALHRFAALAAMVLAFTVATAATAQVGPQLNGRQPTSYVRPSASEALWNAQDMLVDQSIARLPERAPDRPNIYAVAIAPLGTQTLFSREAKVALQALALNYGGTAKAGVLLSNLTDDHMQAPLATQQNVVHVLRAIGRRTRPAPDDVVIVYLTSHGGPDAALQSELPRSLPILAISANSMAIALEDAQIRRRVIIISACFAASWIPRLANDDTIIIAAAAADRTSFGCADDRPLTYFGEAFLTGPFAQGASLADSFESARKTVTQWEQAEKLLPSLPQAYVGTNMQAFWQMTLRLGLKAAPVPKSAAARKVAARR